jgi:hypothetical protein
MTDARAYMLILVDAGRDEHPDLRLVKLLRTFRDYGFTLANAQGSDPPSPGLLETITLEHGVRYDDEGLAERLERLETAAIKRYLMRTWSVTWAARSAGEGFRPTLELLGTRTSLSSPRG